MTSKSLPPSSTARTDRSKSVTTLASSGGPAWDGGYNADVRRRTASRSTGPLVTAGGFTCSASHAAK